MPEIKSDIGAIASMFKEGFALWKTFIATRQEAYNRKMDKRKLQAIECGEKFILIFKDWERTPDVKKKLHLRKTLTYWEIKFFKFNQ